jgi:hypothetical protein
MVVRLLVLPGEISPLLAASPKRSLTPDCITSFVAVSGDNFQPFQMFSVLPTK